VKVKAGSEEVLALVKCIKQFAPNAVKNVKFHSNQLRVNQFIVGIAIPKGEGIRIRY
jgi:hypothetical protein